MLMMRALTLMVLLDALMLLHMSMLMMSTPLQICRMLLAILLVPMLYGANANDGAVAEAVNACM